MAIYKCSRYTKVRTYYPHSGNRKIFDIRERTKYTLRNARYHTWKKLDTLDFISWTNYGNSEFWWAILDANPQYQTELDIKIGDVIAIPTFSEVVKNVIWQT